MNKKLLIIIISLFGAAMSAQNSGKYADHLIAEFFLNDGSSFKGYYRGEINKGSSLGLFNLKSKISSFQYTTIDEEKKKKVDADEVKKIIYYDKDEVTNIQEKIYFKTIDKKGNLSEKATAQFEYLMYDGKIKLYGSNVFICEGGGGCRYSYTSFYIMKSTGPFPVLAIKPRAAISFKVGSSLENTVDAFRIVGGKCAPFNEYLNFFDKTMMKEQQLDKQLEKDYMNFLKEIFQDKDQKVGNNYFYVVADKILEHQMKVFKGIIFEYEKNCE